MRLAAPDTSIYWLRIPPRTLWPLRIYVFTATGNLRRLVAAPIHKARGFQNETNSSPCRNNTLYVPRGGLRRACPGSLQPGAGGKSDVDTHLTGPLRRVLRRH